MKPITNIDDPRYVKALAHPTRIRILAMLEEQPASPAQLARRLDQPIGRLAYHVRALQNFGVIKLVSTRQVRGATEHIYRAVEHPRFSDEAWDGLGPVAKQRMLSAMLQQISDYAGRSAAAGGFDRADAHITRTALKLDEQGWRNLAQLTKRWLQDVAALEEEAVARIAREPAHDPDPLDVGLVIMLFQALPFSRSAAPDAHVDACAGEHEEHEELTPVLAR